MGGDTQNTQIVYPSLTSVSSHLPFSSMLLSGINAEGYRLYCLVPRDNQLKVLVLVAVVLRALAISMSLGVTVS
jgi:hypothetical protein